MEISQYLIEAAESLLKHEGDKGLPQKLANTEFYLAKGGDDSILAFGVIKFKDTEYKIGTAKIK